MLDCGNLGQHGTDIMDAEEREYNDTTVELLQEVSLSFPVASTVNPAIQEPIPKFPRPMSPTQGGKTESTDVRELHDRFAQLRSTSKPMPILSMGFQFQGNKASNSSPPIFNSGIESTFWYFDTKFPRVHSSEYS